MCCIVLTKEMAQKTNFCVIASMRNNHSFLALCQDFAKRHYILFVFALSGDCTHAKWFLSGYAFGLKAWCTTPRQMGKMRRKTWQQK